MTEPLRFEVSELATEVALMQRLAEKFLVADAIDILVGLRDQIDTLRYASRQTTIAIEADRPIRTKRCGGGYERDNGGTRKDLFGELLFKWELRPLGAASKKRGAKRQVEIAGIASSVARLRIDHCGQKVAIASWRMEIGDGKSPGAFFHAQIPDTLREVIHEEQCTCQLFWPTWLPVPRLPIPAMTPMLVLEFIIAELFQKGWPEHLASGRYEVNQWRAMQQRRFEAYLQWQRKNVADSGQGSPILATKNAKPGPELFLSS